MTLSGALILSVYALIRAPSNALTTLGLKGPVLCGISLRYRAPGMFAEQGGLEVPPSSSFLAAANTFFTRDDEGEQGADP